jgi:hypothetical protein
MIRIVRFLFGATILAALAWTGWWHALARGQEAALTHWFDSRARHGWQAEYDQIDLTGFPLRLKRKITGINLADPKTGWAWTAPWLKVESAAFRPIRFDVTLPDTQSLAVPGERTDIASNKMTAALELRPGEALGLIQATINMTDLDVRARAIQRPGWTASAGTLDADISEKVNDDGYAITFLAENVVLPEPLVARIDPTGFAGRNLERMSFDGAAIFDDPIDRHLIEDGHLSLRAATIRAASLQWGKMQLDAKGAIKIDDDGYPDGKIDVTARKWREMIKLARRSDAIGDDLAKGLTRALELVAMIGGDRDEIEATLNFSDGDVRIGPLTIGRAPRLAPPKG